MALSTTEAAKLVGRSRQAIIKAIKTGKLSATKNLNGEWEIEPVELYRVYAPKTTGTPAPPVEVAAPTDEALRRENELLRERISKQDDTISQLLDRLATQQKVTLMLEDKQARPSWWVRLLGR